MDEQLKSVLKNLKENESLISMLLGGLVVIIVGILLFNYYRQSQDRATITEEATSAAEYTLETQTDELTGELMPEGLPLTHTVAKGEHLWLIAIKYYGSGFNWVDIAKENNLGDGNQLAVGHTLTIPKVRVRQPLAALTEPTVTQTSERIAISGGSYTVQKGDSLWTIAMNRYEKGYDWVKIYEANKTLISDPSYIEIGWNLTLP